MVLTKEQREATKTLLAKIQVFKSSSRVLADVFQELPPKKDLPDYYHVVKKPMALDIIKSRAKNGKYATFSDFLRDLSQIFYNAKLYNVRKSVIYADACALEEMLNGELFKLKDTKICAESKLPSIGAVPEGSEDEDMEDAESSDNDDVPRTPKSRAAHEAQKKKESSATPGLEDTRGTSPSASKKRGRPPKVETPDESRMKNILRAVRRIQRDGDTVFEPFEKLPDAKLYPDYYQHIKNPKSLALVKKNVKRKVYPVTGGIEPFITDLKAIFQNAQFYNEDGSSIHKDATYLLQCLDEIIASEVNRPDEDFRNVDTQEKYSSYSGNMVKLARKGVEKILHRGTYYKVGDWVYLENNNDPAHPIIAQIFRTWQNSDGEYWVNVCWYYRAFQTVHRADKLWYEKEVVKTGQYRDHAAQELTGHCYVMYVTKYVRGRPKEWTGPEADLWVCENRYNEEAKTYNKIKAWKSCVPDESREQSSNYEMETFSKVKDAKKFLSPLLHLMPKDKSLWVDPQEGGSTTLKMPEPHERGSMSAPPIMGNILVTSVPSEEKLKEINGELARPEPEPADFASNRQTKEQQQQQQQQHPQQPPQLQQLPPQEVPQTPYYQGPATNLTPGTSIQNQIQQIYSKPMIPQRTPQTPGFVGNTAGTPAVYSAPQYARTTSHNDGSASRRPPPTAYRNGTNSAGGATPAATAAPTVVAPVLPPVQANMNKINSLGSQINPTAMIFIDSLGLKEGTKAWFLRDANGEVMWFSVPPQGTVAPAQHGRVVAHSIKYQAWKRRKLSSSPSSPP